MKKANNFQIAKVQPQSVASLLLTFWQFQPGVAYKSVVYKKNMYFYTKVNVLVMISLFRGMFLVTFRRIDSKEEEKVINYWFFS